MSEVNEDTNDAQSPKKKRSVTSLTLGWLAERLRKSSDIKAKLESGKYEVDSAKVAASLANEDS